MLTVLQVFAVAPLADRNITDFYLFVIPLVILGQILLQAGKIGFFRFLNFKHHLNK